MCESSDFSMIVERRPLLANTISLFSFSRYVITTQSFGSAFCISFLQISSSFANVSLFPDSFAIHCSLSLEKYKLLCFLEFLLDMQSLNRKRERSLLRWYKTGVYFISSLFYTGVLTLHKYFTMVLATGGGLFIKSCKKCCQTGCGSVHSTWYVGPFA